MLSRVAVVVVPDFGDQLIALAAEGPVWVADTPANRAVAERVREGTRESAVAVFRVDPAETPDEWAAGVLSAVVAHHEARSHVVPVDTLELHGVVMTDALRAALARYGFTDVTGDGEIMTARAPAAA